MAYKHLRNRRRTGVTNYKKRVALLKGGIARVVVRKSNRSVLLQIVDYAKDGDRVVAYANSKELRQFGWSPRCNIPTAYLTGLLLSKKAKGKNDLIADTGLYRPIKSSVVFAAIKGCVDGGMKIRSAIEMDEKRLSGASIKDYASKIKDTDKFGKQFSAYAEEKFDVLNITDLFAATKKKILE